MDLDTRKCRLSADGASMGLNRWIGVTSAITALTACGVVVLIVFAVSSISVASASAANPQYVLASGGFPVGFTWTGGAFTWETPVGERVECGSGSSGAGSILNPKGAEATLTLTGCATTFFGFPTSCKTPGKGSGEIQTKALSSHLYYNVGKTQVVDELQPATGTIFAEFECVGNSVIWAGSLLGDFQPINKQLHAIALVFEETGGLQGIREYETEEGERVAAHLTISKNGGAPVDIGVGTTGQLTLEGVRQVEIKG